MLSEGACFGSARKGQGHNKALIALLSKSLGIPKSRLAFVSGDTARKKILRIEGEPEDLIKRLGAVINGG